MSAKSTALATLVAGLALLAPAHADNEVILSASDGAAWAALGGHILDMSGDVVIADNDKDGSASHVLYVYRRSGSGWDETILDPGWCTGCGVPGSAAIDGNTIAVGGSQTAGVIIYEYDGSAWQQTQALPEPGVRTGIGWTAIDLDGNRLAVGAPLLDSVTCTNHGGVFIYERSAPGSPFVLQQTVYPVDPCGPLPHPGGSPSGIGQEVNLSGDTLLVDLRKVFLRSDSSGFTFAQLVTPGSQTFVAALDGDTLVYGRAQYAEIPPTTCPPRVPGCVPDPGLVPGALKIYTRTAFGQDFLELQTALEADDPVHGAALGTSVALDGDQIIAGAVGVPAAYRFTRSGPGAEFVQAEKITPCASPGLLGTDGYGATVALDGATLAVGDPKIYAIAGGVYIPGDCSGAGNQPPVADAGGDRTVSATCSEAGGSTAVALDGSGSWDPDGDTLSYVWSGSFGTASGMLATVDLSLGSNGITLAVDDGNGGQADDAAVVTVVDDTPPTVHAPAALTVSCTSFAGDGRGQAVAGDPDVANWLASATATDACDATVTAGSDAGAAFGMGSTPVTWTAADASGNTSSDASALTVVYDFGGFQPPLLDDGSASIRQGKQGRTIPVKFSLGCGGSATGTATATIEVYLVVDTATGSVDTTDFTQDSGQSADGGNLFRYDSADEHYIYNLSTVSMSADATYRIVVTLDDGTQHAVDFSLR